MEACIKATVVQINPRNGKQAERIGYGETHAEALKMAIAGRKTWEIVSVGYEGDMRKTQEEIQAEMEAEFAGMEALNNVWTLIHWGK